MPLLIVGAILAAAYFAGKALRPKATLSIDAQEALAPAPYTTEGTPDNLSPDDFRNPFTELDLHPTDETGPNILWDWTSPPPPVNPGRKYDDPTRKPKHLKEGSDLMKMGCANIKNFPDMPPDKVRADGHTISKHVTIWGGQEIQPGEDAPVILEGLQASGQRWSAVWTEFSEPIFYRTDLWEPFDQYHMREEHPASLPGAHGLWDAITSSAFKSLRHNGVEFALVNCHLVVGAYNGQHSTHDRRILRDQWQKEWTDFRTVINYHFSKGRSVFFEGDLNRAFPPVPYRGSHWLATGMGIDHIGFISHGHGVRFVTRGAPMGGKIPLNSDHDLRHIQGSLIHR